MAAPSMSTEEIQASLQALLDGPAGRPPLGIVPNFQHPSNLDAIVFPTVAICLTTTTLAVLARLYTRLFLLRSIAREDCKSL